MFNKEILQEDIELIKHLHAQRFKCVELINNSIRDLIQADNLSKVEIDNEKASIADLTDLLTELTKEIQILEEQMFLNFTSEFSFTNLPKSSGKLFPHINTINN